MKNMMILYTALIFFALSTVLSLTAYQKESSAADALAAPSVQTSLGMEQVITPASATLSPQEGSPDKQDTTVSQRALTWVRKIEFQDATKSSHHPSEPASIFLFGAGLVGLAIFTRRKFQK